MDNLFKKLANNEMPNFFDIMQAISEIGKMWPTSDCPDCKQWGQCDTNYKYDLLEEIMKRKLEGK